MMFKPNDETQICIPKIDDLPIIFKGSENLRGSSGAIYAFYRIHQMIIDKSKNVHWVKIIIFSINAGSYPPGIQHSYGKWTIYK